MGRKANWALAPALIWACLVPNSGQAQAVIERDTKVTGPRGRTTERDIRVQRGPGYVDRQVEIKRPGGTILRDTRISTGGGRPWGPPGPGPGPRFYGGPRVVEEVFVPGPPIVEEVFVPRPPLFSAVVGAPFFNLFLGGASPPPPPPPPPVLVYPEPGGVYGQPTILQPAAPAPPPQEQLVLDPTADAVGRLKSLHSNSRRDGALELGHLGDDRAITPLIERLQHDNEKEVRVAAAWALGEIGDPRAGVPLERAALYDKRHEVRDAATIAHRRLPKPGAAPDQAEAPPESTVTSRVAPPAMSKRSTVGTIRAAAPNRAEEIDPGPTPAPLDDRPPPPPGPDLESPRSRP